jgi:GxxExxY protein
MTKAYLDKLTYQIIGCAIEVHKTIGPGLLESIYQKCFEEELKQNARFYNKQFSVPINFNCNNIFKEGQRTRVNQIYAALPQE